MTGGASGIGRAVIGRLSSRIHLYSAITVVDLSFPSDYASSLSSSSSSSSSSTCELSLVSCDVSQRSCLHQALAQHVDRFGPIDVLISNAGIGDGERNATEDTQRAVQVNLLAVIHAAQIASSNNLLRRGAAVVNVASTGGIWPMQHQPVYAATKAAVIMFTRSMAPVLYAENQVRMTALCPTYTKNTGFGDALLKHPNANQFIFEATRGAGMASLESVVDAVEVLVDGGVPGQTLVVVPGKHVTWRWAGEGDNTTTTPTKRKSTSPSLLAPLPQLPAQRNVVMVHTLSTNFQAATTIIQEPMPQISGNKVLVTRCFAGVNASDVNYTAGRYFGKRAESMLPFPAGLESVGYVSAVGPEAAKRGVRVGQPVSTLEYGAFSTHGVVSSDRLLPCSSPPSPEAVALLTSGLTASLALQRTARLRPVGEKGVRRKRVLVTAAAGGTGQFAVQLAKIWGHEVIATCGSEAKAELLRHLGAHRVINYKKEQVGAVLKSEYKKGVDVIFESVGGKMFDACTKNVAVGGIVVVIGMMSQYNGAGGDAGGWPASSHPGLNERLLWRGASASGFFLLHHASHYKSHLLELHRLHTSGVLKVAVDPREFVGIESASDAVEHLQSGQSAGKVVIRLASNVPNVAVDAKL